MSPAGPPNKPFIQQVQQNQIDAARAYEARRRRDAADSQGGRELWRSLAGLLFGLIAIGVVVFLAWQAGLFG
jgi:hypothetical protein